MVPAAKRASCNAIHLPHLLLFIHTRWWIASAKIKFTPVATVLNLLEIPSNAKRRNTSCELFATIEEKCGEMNNVNDMVNDKYSYILKDVNRKAAYNVSFSEETHRKRNEATEKKRFSNSYRK